MRFNVRIRDLMENYVNVFVYLIYFMEYFMG